MTKLDLISTSLFIVTLYCLHEPVMTEFVLIRFGRVGVTTGGFDQTIKIKSFLALLGLFTMNGYMMPILKTMFMQASVNVVGDQYITNNLEPYLNIEIIYKLSVKSLYFYEGRHNTVSCKDFYLVSTCFLVFFEC